MCSVHVLPDDCDLVAVLEGRIDHDPFAGILARAGPVGAQDPRLRHRRKSFTNPEIEMVERRGTKTDQYLAGAWFRVGCILVAQDLRAPVLMNPNRFHAGTISHT